MDQLLQLPLLRDPFPRQFKMFLTDKNVILVLRDLMSLAVRAEIDVAVADPIVLVGIEDVAEGPTVLVETGGVTEDLTAPGETAVESGIRTVVHLILMTTTLKTPDSLVKTAVAIMAMAVEDVEVVEEVEAAEEAHHLPALLLTARTQTVLVGAALVGDVVGDVGRVAPAGKSSVNSVTPYAGSVMRDAIAITRRTLPEQVEGHSSTTLVWAEQMPGL